MKVILSIRAALRHTPGLLILVGAIALFGGALGVALATERAALHDRPAPPAGTKPKSLASKQVSVQLTTATTPEPVDIPNAHMNYYDIEGNSAQDLRSQMNALGPTDGKGAHSDAFTEWYVSWRWPGYGTPKCDLTQVQVSYAITVTFPNWRAPNESDPTLVDQWQRYTLRLALHEKGHVDNVVKNQHTFQQAIEQATCETADSAARQVLDRLHDFDVNYDKKTQHGATQGATFP